MIEEVLSVLIKELGPTGLMLAGLYFILMRVGSLVATHLGVINHNTTAISEHLAKISEKYCEK